MTTTGPLPPQPSLFYSKYVKKTKSPSYQPRFLITFMKFQMSSNKILSNPSKILSKEPPNNIKILSPFFSNVQNKKPPSISKKPLFWLYKILLMKNSKSSLLWVQLNLQKIVNIKNYKLLFQIYQINKLKKLMLINLLDLFIIELLSKKLK